MQSASCFHFYYENNILTLDAYWYQVLVRYQCYHNDYTCKVEFESYFGELGNIWFNLNIFIEYKLTRMK